LKELLANIFMKIFYIDRISLFAEIQYSSHKTFANAEKSGLFKKPVF
jgi:hypothetical protein